MKKIISLILALVMIVSCMAGLALAVELDESVPSQAMWQAKTADGTAYYIKELDSVAMEWAIEQAGGATFTALKGGVLASANITIPADWDAKNPIVIDLNGYTFTADKDINMSGDGNLTVKNGTVAFNGNVNNSFLCFGKTSAGNNNGSGYYYNPTMTLENLYINFNIPADAKVQNVPMLLGKTIHHTLNIKNTTLVTNNKDFCSLGNYENLAGPVNMNIENSILVSQNNRAFRLWKGSADPTINLTISNSAIVTSDGTVAVASAPMSINGTVATGSGAKAGGELVDAWAGKTPDGQDIAGKATVYGTAPAATTIPASVKIELPADPVVTPPVVDTPVVTPPVVDTPVVTPPVVDTPVVTPPVVDTPVVTPPVVDDPVVTPPVVDDPVVTPPVVDDPVVTPPADDKDPEPLTPVVPVTPGAADSGLDMTMIVVIACAAIVVVAAVVVVIVVTKKKKD